MKFNCGPSQEVRDELYRKEYHERRQAREQWHSWYAWFPVRVGEDDCRWLELVERKQRYEFPHIKCGEYWEYRAIPPSYRFAYAP